MNKFIVLILCSLLTLTSFAQTEGVNFEHGTLQDALNKAKANKKGPKLVLLDCYTTWCGPCKYMANSVFPTKEAGDYFNKNFVSIKIDMEKGEGPNIAKKYSVSAYPTFLILDAQGNETGRVVGGGDLAGFIKSVESAMDVKNSPAYVKSIYDADKNLDNAVAYLKALDKAYKRGEIGTFITENLSTFKVSEIFSAPMWKYFSRNMSDKNPQLLSYLLENKAAAEMYLGQERINQAIIDVYAQSLLMYLGSRKELSQDQIKEASGIINLLSGSNNKTQLLCAKISLLYAGKNMEEIGKLYQFKNYSSYSLSEMQNIERIFTGIKEITKEQIEQYYNDKADFFTKQIKNCNDWKAKFLKER